MRRTSVVLAAALLLGLVGSAGYTYMPFGQSKAASLVDPLDLSWLYRTSEVVVLAQRGNTIDQRTEDRGQLVIEREYRVLDSLKGGLAKGSKFVLTNDFYSVGNATPTLLFLKSSDGDVYQKTAGESVFASDNFGRLYRSQSPADVDEFERFFLDGNRLRPEKRALADVRPLAPTEAEMAALIANEIAPFRSLPPEEEQSAMLEDVVKALRKLR